MRSRRWASSGSRLLVFGDARKVFPRWCSGDVDGARAASSRARVLGVTALCPGRIFTMW
ncbi:MULTISPECIES: CD225/dispanin family protein [Rhodococcus]|uniref:CD225/dispanin family protein n=1 Tax=Rhodococcus sp. IEGM 1351 TaxID=3047089 RepID=UPI002FDDBA7B